VAPGQRLLPTAGSTRNVLSVARAMSEWADVTVAFRGIAEPVVGEAFKVISIEEVQPSAHGVTDDVAIRGLNPFVHMNYLHGLRRFAAQVAGTYDIIFEKGWRFSGYLSYQVARYGGRAALIENDCRHWNEPLRDLQTVARFGAQAATQFVAGWASRRAPLIIAETDELKEVLAELRGIARDRIEVVELGVDHGMFFPQDAAAARASLGIAPDRTVLLYVGGLDIYHDLGPVIEGLGSVRRPDIELHVVGDGELRAQYAASAKRLRVNATFHGQKSHRVVPGFIAAADLCLAPYQPSRFYKNRIVFSTLKIPEYMACARPVASVPHGHIRQLIDHRSTGFLLENEVNAWREFLPELPSREQLAVLGARAAARVAGMSWQVTAQRYLEAAQRIATV
jgi:glycosyltransferase involved in cell wall biosynthesis